MTAVAKKKYPIEKYTNGDVDPTKNVLQLVDAAVQRLDDLREADGRRVDEVQRLHVTYAERLAMAESKRIDAIRAVDVAAVQTASDRANAQALVLANQVATSAETLRTLVASTAAAVASSLQQVSGALTERLAMVEKGQYENKGLSGVSPQVLQRLADLERTGNLAEGKGEGKTAISGPLWAIGASILTAIAIFLLMRAIGK
jgi:hypothetical protein